MSYELEIILIDIWWFKNNYNNDLSDLMIQILNYFVKISRTKDKNKSQIVYYFITCI